MLKGNAQITEGQKFEILAAISKSAPAIFGEMDSTTAQSWIENPKGLQKVLKKALCPSVETINFPIWKTIELGTGLKTADDFRKAIEASGYKISKWASDILNKQAFTVASEKTELDLVKITGVDLGFTKNVTRKKIYDRAIKLGLELCPNESGPQLRLQYKDQPNGEWLYIAIEPIVVSDGDLNVFLVKRDDDDPWLNASCDSLGDLWGPESMWVFVSPRRK